MDSLLAEETELGIVHYVLFKVCCFRASVSYPSREFGSTIFNSLKLAFDGENAIKMKAKAGFE